MNLFSNSAKRRRPRRQFLARWASWMLCCAALATCASNNSWSQDVDPQVLEAERDRVAVMERATRSAVAVFAAGGQGGGSAVVISPDGYAVSNFHVTAAAGAAMKCGLSDGIIYDAVIVGLDPTGDVALLKLLGRDDFPCAELADSDDVRVGDWCFVAGNPFLLATDLQPSVSYGVISGVHRYQYPAGSILEYTDCLQTDAAINPGNSGGPLYDAQGRLIGIVGRGSFEKRGRVNVGVGYAISINQVKNFLGHLKSGRIVDHATLGAVVRSDDNRRVLVDDILFDSDAFRRGLRMNDELISFGGRPVNTVNSFKNVLGIFPKGWRVPMTYQHRGERMDVLVRLRAVHRESELAELLEGAPQAEPDKAPAPRPGDPIRGPRRGNDRRERPEPRPAQAKAEIPDAVKPYYIEKPGYVNYYFNQLHRDRVWKASVAASDYSGLKNTWTLRSRPASEEVRFDISDESSSIKTPGGSMAVELSGNLADRLEPRGSGGLLVSLAMWRRFLLLGPDGFDEVTYLGTAPLPGYDDLLDVLVGKYRDIECRFLFDPEDGLLAALEMFPEEETDPCELYFREYRDVAGCKLPARIDVHHGDINYQFTSGKRFSYEFAEKEE